MNKNIFFKKKNIKLSKIFLKHTFKEDFKIDSIKPLLKAKKKDITFFDSLKYKEDIKKTSAIICITSNKLEKFLPNKINKIMNESAISLNILRDQNYTSHNMKTFEIPSNNGLMLTTRSQEQDIFFKENKYCFMYSSTKELNKKIHYIITNPKRAAIVRKNGFNQVKKYSYINRVKNLVKELNLLQK